MVWFWKKKPAAGADAAQAVVDAAVANAQQSDQAWQRQAAQLRKDEKRLEKQRAKAAKRELAEMKKQAKRARKARAAADKAAKKQARVVRKVQKRELKAERKRAKAIVKLRHANEKRRKRLQRKREKEARRRRKQAQAQCTPAPVAHDPSRVEAVGITSAPMGAPSFKNDKHCKSCHTTFQRLPTRRRHHCRNCGDSFCSKCLSRTKRPIPWFKLDKPQKVCFSCDVQVFNGMGGTTRPASRAGSSETPVASGIVSPASERPSPSRSASFQSEQPQDSPRTASPSRSGVSLGLRPRSRRDTSSSKSKKSGSLWSLPIHPLLKRKSSADQLRNRTWDLDLRLEKEEMLARQRQSQMIVVTGAPQFATAS